MTAPALLIVVSTDADVRRRVAAEVTTGEAVVVVVAASLEQAGALLRELAGATSPPPAALPEPESDISNLGGLLVDRRRHEVSHHGVPIALTPNEFHLLEVLVRDPDRVWKHDDLHQEVWQSDSLGNHSDLEAAVKRLRRKLRLAASTVQITAVRGFGYRLEVAQAATAAISERGSALLA